MKIDTKDFLNWVQEHCTKCEWDAPTTCALCGVTSVRSYLKSYLLELQKECNSALDAWELKSE